MDLPDCPPGAEGYEDSVVEMPKKPDGEESCTKAEQEFQDHLNSLKIKLENGEARCMVERRGRDISGKWIYLCYPCAAVCSGESILQTHISGKKHKSKLSLKNSWPVSIFDDHPFNQNQRGGPTGSTATTTVLQKMAAEVEIHKRETEEMESKFNKYRKITCHIQDALDELEAPLVGVEYLIEHPPEEVHYEPRYICTLCMKQGHPRTILNHLTCFWHRFNYLLRHFPTASGRLSNYKSQTKYREGTSIIMTRLSQRIEDIHGRMKPIHIDSEVYEKEKEQIMQWIFKGPHITEKPNMTFEEVVDIDLIESLAKTHENIKKVVLPKKKDPSPPVVAAPSKPLHLAQRHGRERHISIESLSDISDDDTKRGDLAKVNSKFNKKDRLEQRRPRYEPYPDPRRNPAPTSFRSRYAIKNPADGKKEEKQVRPPPNYEYKVKLATEKRQAAEESAKSLLAYHEKNPEKHPLYPEEWKKFWNRRYKEIQAEGKDPSKHDFKPEWIVFWTKRMKELHDEELRVQILEIYRRLNMPNEMSKLAESPIIEIPDSRRKSPEPRRRSPDRRRRSPDFRPHEGRRSPEPRRRSPELRRRSPVPRRRSPEPRRRSPDLRRRSPELRRRSPVRRPDYRPNRRSPEHRHNMDKLAQNIRRSPFKRTRSRSPISRNRSSSRPHMSERSSRSPLSRREAELRNRSPLSRRESAAPPRNRSPLRDRDLAPCMQTVMISDDELKPDDGLSPWNSENEIDSVISIPPSHAGSNVSAARRREAPDLGPPENVVATLRVLVALEDYLGSLGPKIVDLLTEALRMEKEKANSSEELLDRESALVLIETAKEKLKGAAQAGLVAAPAAPAVRAAVLRAAAALHHADTRARQKPAPTISKAEPVPVAGVGEVDRAQIAQQMAAALIAQGKTDVTSEELAQLVDAVVGMAEAKKQKSECKKSALKIVPDKPRPAVKMSGTATALQMLQSAYDENDKKLEKEDAPDAMDGLSDSDLETLLKNFNELSAEEQHSLIAYLKKLEAREPQRVERLRQYVSAAATSAPPREAEEQSPPKQDAIPVTIESDDDDYTVEEVFQSATQKVKEDQIRKELDIVKKSLEESKEEENMIPSPQALPIKDIVNTPVDISKNLSSATNLFALVQASIKSTAAITPASNTHAADVVAINAMPRSFGDAPVMRIESLATTVNSQPAQTTSVPKGSFDQQDDSSEQSSNQSNFNRNYQNEQFNQNEKYNKNEQFNQNEQYNENEQFNQNQQYNQNEQLNQNDSYDNDNQNQAQWNPNNNNMNNMPMPGNRGPIRDQPYNKNNFAQGGNSQMNSGPSNQFGQISTWEPNKDWQGKSAPTQNWTENSAPPQIWQGTGQPQNWQGDSAPTQSWQGNSAQSQNWQGNNPAQTPNWQGPAQTQNWQEPNQYNQTQNQGMRGNFANGRMRDNSDSRPHNANKNQQQFGTFNNNNNNNFRGRGGGRPMRGRGRGRY